MSQFAHSRTLTCLCGSFSWDAGVCGAPVMADQEETFGLQNSPSGSESRDVQSENKPEKQNGTSSKSPSSQTTYIQQVSVARSVGRSVGLSVGLGASPFQAAFTDLWGHTHCKTKCISRLIIFLLNSQFLESILLFFGV